MIAFVSHFWKQSLFLHLPPPSEEEPELDVSMCLSPPPLTPTACGITEASNLVDVEGKEGWSWGLHSLELIGNSDTRTQESRC